MSISSAVPRLAVTACAAVALVCAAAPAPARAIDPLKPLCSAVGLFSGMAGKVCTVARKGGHLLTSAAQRLLGGRASGRARSVLTAGRAVGVGTGVLGLAGLVTWTTGGAQFALRETATLMAATTSPRLTSPWFSRVYWRVAAIAIVLTLPFLFAAAIQAVLRGDLPLLARAALGYLPLALVGVNIAAQLTTLLLGVVDGLCALVESAASDSVAHFLGRAASGVGAFSFSTASPFLAFFVAVFTVAGAVVLWLELVMREAAVYVVVMMLPLAFAAMVWPARRVWALRAVELLVALILAKLAMVAVLALGGAALTGSASPAAWLTGVVLLLLGVFAPWAMLRLIPVAELGSSAIAHLRSDTLAAAPSAQLALATGDGAHGWASATTAQMARDAELGDPQRGADAQLQGLRDGGHAGTRDTEEPEREAVAAAAVPDVGGGSPGGAGAAPVDDGEAAHGGVEGVQASAQEAAAPSARDAAASGARGEPQRSGAGDRPPGSLPPWRPRAGTLDFEDPERWLADLAPVEPPLVPVEPPPEPDEPPPEPDERPLAANEPPSPASGGGGSP